MNTGLPHGEIGRMTKYPFLPSDMTGLYNRVLRRKSSEIGSSSAELRGQAPLSAEAKRRRILEEAKSAVLDRIRHPREYNSP